MSSGRLDSYITSSIALLEANPSSTVVSIKYESGAKAGKVSFRTSNPQLLARYKFSTSKSKDVSRLLSAVGPRGVSITPGKVAKRRCRAAPVIDVNGMSTLLANRDIPEAREEAPQPKAAGKKKKNKNKKR
ncbi:LANO_0D07008g1_1 [Lachancea nothofagi CBS 11611]|uniref:LANO_0D07008g1_1 n=1 Tax=Lachancea nothofagi CBS 11611 TaxID=1266666 RepID=A0A1G4JHY4_9SACH|nr:LANO_0D07008g1_1 [Lachancea nothofagi CBS 11611]